jgi:methyl-accepting chemotaxis protein
MRLTGNTDVEDSLERLDKLTQEEGRIASAEVLKMTHSVADGVKGVDGKVQDVCSDVHDVGDKVQGVEGRAQDVRGDVQGVRVEMQELGNKVQDVDHRVQGVDDKLDHANRSLFL